ncbi:MAG: hypothetical protein Q9164_001278 [Protoblastenia rupestris]
MAPLPPSQPSAAVAYHGKGYHVIREGLAEILTPAGSASNNGDLKVQKVFYNPIQQYNRDLSVLAIRAFADDYAFVREGKKRQRRENWKEARGKKRKRESAQEVKGKDGIPQVDTEQQEDAVLQNGSLEGEAPVKNIKVGEISIKTDDIDGLKPPKETDNQDRDPPTCEDNSSQPFRILDALSATGLRALRYGKEVPMATRITANDLSASATASIRLNVEHNGLSSKIQPSTSDAIDHMHHSTGQPTPGSGQYHAIDLDPYGTAAPFLDAAIRALVDGGLLCVTCTDAGVFASLGYLEKTYSQYGGLPLKGPHAHEGGIRLILHAIATAAARNGIAIEPLLSLSIDFYARIFVRIHRSPAEVKFLASKTMMVHNCDSGCGAWSTQHLAQAKAKENKKGETIYKFTSALGPTASPECEHCGFKTHLAGPMWGGPLHNPAFVEQILTMLPSLDKEVYATIPRIEGMLTIALNESLDAALPTHGVSKSAATETSEPTNTSTPEPPKTPSKPSEPPQQDAHGSAPLPRPVPPLTPSIRAHHPFFFTPSTLSGILHCVSPSDAAVRGALLRLGYRTTRSHTKAGSIVTDAPWKVIWEVMREWVRQKAPVKEGVIRSGTPGYGIMAKARGNGRLRDVRETMIRVGKCGDLEEVEQNIQALLYRIGKGQAFGGKGEGADQEDEHEDEGGVAIPQTKKARPLRPHGLDIVFDEELGKREQGRKMVRYQHNPPDWGPRSKAKGDSVG